MEKRYRQPQDVVGWNPELLAHWDAMPGKVQLRLLDSDMTVSTLGELKMLEEHFSHPTS